MARNVERDRREARQRKDRLIEEGFRLFSKYGIEAVSLHRVAEAADVGTATMYKYFQTKEKLVIAISARVWSDFWQDVLTRRAPDDLERLTAYQGIAFYADQIIALYQEQPELLHFSGEYKTFIRHSGVEDAQLREHLDVLEPIRSLFHRMYERARVNGSIRTDIPEQQMFTTVVITMLSVAERYAQGIVWANDHKDDHTQELVFLKEMLLAWCAGKAG
ncbi:MAG: TetR/AcrR family transcriptional regulator [Aristaeellaceae bacterium]